MPFLRESRLLRQKLQGSPFPLVRLRYVHLAAGGARKPGTERRTLGLPVPDDSVPGGQDAARGAQHVAKQASSPETETPHVRIAILQDAAATGERATARQRPSQSQTKGPKHAGEDETGSSEPLSKG